MTNQEAKEALKNKSLVKSNDPAKDLIVMMDKLKPQFAKVLPKHITPERIVRTALTCVRQNPQLLRCSPESFIGALFQASQVGLEPGGPLGLCYLIPYKNECQFQISYKGYKELCYRSGNVSFIGAYAIRKDDELELHYGSDGQFKYKPNFSSVPSDVNPVIVYISYIKYKDGAESYLHMTPPEVERIRTKYSKSSDSPYSPWQTEYEEMALKTVIKKHLKRERLSPEFNQALNKDETESKAMIYKSETEIIDFDDFIEVQDTANETV